MGRTKEERLNIGRQIYNNEITVSEAAVKYDVDFYTARRYLREYTYENKLPKKSNSSNFNNSTTVITVNEVKNKSSIVDYEVLKSMSKDELIDELIKARANEERAKKGYQVKGGGQEKEFIILKKTNSK